MIMTGNKDYEITVGIKTDGAPLLERYEEFTLLRNMLIGDGFHWQRRIEAKLPGEVIELELSNLKDGLNLDCGNRNVSLINRLPLETYLECVVGSEMNPGAPMEFLKAHAVISRSWALGKVLNLHYAGAEGTITTPNKIIGWDDSAVHKGFNVCSDDHCQRYQGLQTISEKGKEAIRSTRGEVLYSQNGHLVDARFSKCCGGTTELFSTCWQDKDVECLESIRDPWCDLSTMKATDRDKLLSGILKNYDLMQTGYGFRWEERVDKAFIADNLKEKYGIDLGEISSLTVIRRGPSGRINLLKISGEKGEMTIGKELRIRTLLSPSCLYSSAFEIEDRGENFSLKGKGWGHGVGLCQIGAANMALHGYDYRQILSFYYPGAVISASAVSSIP